jgi:hypothetical protein
VFFRNHWLGRDRQTCSGKLDKWVSCLHLEVVCIYVTKKTGWVRMILLVVEKVEKIDAGGFFMMK